MDHASHDASDYAPPNELGEMELYHPKTFLGKYVWSQDAKVIAIQYSITAIAIGIVALVLSWLMRLQLGFPNTFTFINPSNYLHQQHFLRREPGSLALTNPRSPCGLSRLQRDLPTVLELLLDRRLLGRDQFDPDFLVRPDNALPFFQT